MYIWRNAQNPYAANAFKGTQTYIFHSFDVEIQLGKFCMSLAAQRLVHARDREPNYGIHVCSETVGWEERWEKYLGSSWQGGGK